MAAHAFDVAFFQAQFPEFASANTLVLTSYWTMATEYMGSGDTWRISGTTKQLALNLMTAHIARVFDAAGTNGGAAAASSGLVTSATEGSVSVSMTPPPAKSGWQYWLSTTPYGLQLWALLQAKAAGGAYIAPSLERAAFRKAAGRF